MGPSRPRWTRIWLFLATVCCSLVCCSLLASGALAQGGPARVGAVLSQTGAARALGGAQAAALRSLVAEWGRTSSDTVLELVIADDLSLPAAAIREARRLVEEEGVLALICCSPPEATAALAPYLEGAGVLTLSPSALPEGSASEGAAFWLFSLEPDRRRLLQASVLAQAAAGHTRFGLMTLEGDFGDAVAAELASLIDPAAGVQLVVEQRYPQGASVLTPEALWVATRLPETVFVWGDSADSVLALRALAARGYRGEVVLDPTVLGGDGLAAGGFGAGGLTPGGLERFGALRAPVSPAAVADTLSPLHLTYGLTQAYRAAVPPRSPAAGAYAYDALRLVAAALEQAYTYGVAGDDPRVLRGVLRDAFIGMGPVAGAGASYDFREGDPVGVLPQSLVLSRLEGGRLVSPD